MIYEDVILSWIEKHQLLFAVLLYALGIGNIVLFIGYIGYVVYLYLGA